jgi:hypothetical protein
VVLLIKKTIKLLFAYMLFMSLKLFYLSMMVKFDTPFGFRLVLVIMLLKCSHLADFPTDRWSFRIVGGAKLWPIQYIN